MPLPIDERWQPSTPVGPAFEELIALDLERRPETQHFWRGMQNMASTRPAEEPRIPVALPVGGLITGLLAKAFGEDPNQAVSGFMTGYKTGDEMIEEQKRRQREAEAFRMRQEEAEREKERHVAEMRNQKFSEALGIAQAMREGGIGNGPIAKMLEEELAPLGIPLGKYGAQIMANDEVLFDMIRRAQEDPASWGPADLKRASEIVGNKYHPMAPIMGTFLEQSVKAGKDKPIGSAKARELLKEYKLPEMPATVDLMGGLDQQSALEHAMKLGAAYDRTSRDDEAPKGVDALNEYMRRLMEVRGDPTGEQKLMESPDFLGLRTQAYNYIAGEGVEGIDKRIGLLNEQLEGYLLEDEKLDMSNPEVRRITSDIAALQELAGRPISYLFDAESGVDVGRTVSEFLAEKYAEAEGGKVNESVDTLRSELISKLDSQYPSAGPGTREQEGESSWAGFVDRVLREHKADLESSGYSFGGKGVEEKAPAPQPFGVTATYSWGDPLPGGGRMMQFGTRPTTREEMIRRSRPPGGLPR